ncbi:MAG TPA: glycosyltransferase family 2 protein [Actinomycetota bacterium]|nr:glycosyltransferase family 2 protein [Actinomycetota bacterium]
MLALRIVGGIFAAAFFALALIRYRRRQISRLNLIISSLISAALLLLAIAPGLFNPLFEVFNFEPGNGQRLTAVLLFAVGILFVLVIRMQSAVDTSERGIRQLVESFGQSAFDWDTAADLPAGKRIVVVSPAHNEAENVGAVIEAMPPEVEGYHVIPIVIDDRSDDGTAEAARAAGALAASLPIRRGGGLALRVGYDIALTLGADIVATMDADGQHQPEELPTVVGPIIDGRADHVNGSRMLGDFERESLIRHLGVHFFSRVVTILTGQRVTDISSGYRATRADTLRALILEQDQFWTSEVTIEALRQRARVVEVPVTFLTRRGGVSKKPKSLRYGWNFSKAIVKTWLR